MSVDAPAEELVIPGSGVYRRSEAMAGWKGAMRLGSGLIGEEWTQRVRTKKAPSRRRGGDEGEGVCRGREGLVS